MPDDEKTRQWVAEELGRLNQRLDQVATAFVRDDLGQPDYHGHRLDHKRSNDEDKVKTSVKIDLAKQILGLGLTLLLTAIAGYYGLTK